MDLLEKYSLKTLDKLVIDTSGEKYIVRKDEEEGVKDIRELVHTSKVEGAWAYLPDEELWIWIAKGEPQPEQVVVKDGKSRSIMEVLCDLEFMENVLLSHHNFIAYHFHTADYSMSMEYREKELREIMPNIENFVVELFKEDYRKELSFRVALPLGNDMGIMTDLCRKFYWVNPFGKTSHKVCSEWGVSEYYLTKEGREFFDCAKVLPKKGGKVELNEIEKAKQSGELHKIIKETERKILSIPLENELSSEEAVNKIIEGIKHPYFEVVFTPYAE